MCFEFVRSITQGAAEQTRLLLQVKEKAMKLSTALIAGVAAAAGVAAVTPARANAIVGTVNELYAYTSESGGVDYGAIFVTAVAAAGYTLTNVQISGYGPNGPFGPVAPGGSTLASGQGDPDDGGYTTVTVTGLANGVPFYDVGSTWDGSLSDLPVMNALVPSSTIPVYDIDANVTWQVGLLATAVPEPASMALL